MSNSSVNSLDYEDQLQIISIRLAVYGWLCLPIAIIGILLNCFSIYILLHPKMKSISTNIYLTALSLSNIICLLNYIIFYSLRYLISYKNFKNIILSKSINTQIDEEINYTAIYYENFCNIILWAWSPIFLTIQLFSIYLTCAITIDRSIYILFPFDKDVYCSKTRTLKAIYLIFFLTILFNLPRWFEVTYEKHFDSFNNITHYRAKKTQFGLNKNVQSLLHYYAYIIFVYLIPFCLLLIFNTLIIHQMAKHLRKKKELLRGYSRSEFERLNKETSLDHLKDSKVTFMVIAVVCLFFCCQLPYLIVTILSVNYDSKYVHLLKTFSDFFSILNSCINFCIYAFFGETFRTIAKEKLCKNQITE